MNSMLIIEDGELLLCLKILYDFESPRVSGAHGGTPKFNPWSKEEVLQNTSISEDKLDVLISLLKDKRQIISIPAYDDFPKRYQTRTAEMVRTLGTMHEYVNRQTEENSEERQHLQIIEATKWVPALLERPDREVTISEFLEKLRIEMEDRRIKRVKSLNINNVLYLVELTLTAIARNTLYPSKDIDGFKITKFQERAINEALLSSFSGVNQGNSMIISAGTGSGKTIAFTVPVLVDAVLDTIESKPDEEARWTQLMLYPRNDLAFDQFSTLKSYCGELNHLLSETSIFREVRLTIALDADGWIKNEIEQIPHRIKSPLGQWDKKWKKPNVVGASISRYGGFHPHIRNQPYRPANIIVAGSESFRRRLMIPEVSNAVKSSLQRVILDEIHLAEGLQGGHLRGLFNRLKSITGKRKLDFIGASATISSPEMHVQSVWGTPHEYVKLVSPSPSESKGAPGGIANHILVRPRSGVTKGGPVYNATTLVGHQSKEKSWFDDRQAGLKNPRDIDKMICFADSLDFVSRWQMLLNENEANAHFQRIVPSQIVGKGSGGVVRLPYAYWFDRPLAQQLGDTTICDACTKCEKATESRKMTKEQIQNFRTKVGGNSKPEKFVMEILRDEANIISVNSLDECPHLQAGTCWHFAPGIGKIPLVSKDPLPSSIAENLVLRPGDDGAQVFKNTLRSRRHTAESRGGGDDGLSVKDFTADGLYLHKSGESYPLQHSYSDSGIKIVHDTIVATPTLEVGVDMKNVTNIVTHRAMRNEASYRQKAGRAGREKNSVSNTVTILSKNPGDYQLYRNEQKLIFDDLDNPVPVANRNRMVMKSQAYMAVMDWLAIKNCNIEEIQNINLLPWRERLTSAHDLLKSNKEELKDWISSGFRTGLDAILSSRDIYEAIDVFISHLKLILYGQYEDENEDRFSIVGQFIISISDQENANNPLNPKPKGIGQNLDKHLRDLPTMINDVNKSINADLIDLLETINKDLENDISNEGLIQKGIDELNNIRDKMDRSEGRKLRKLIELLEDILDSIDDGVYVPTKEQKLAQDIFKMRNRTAKHYFSWLLSELPAFSENAPYCFIEKVFGNPHDKPINVEIREGGKDSRRIKQSMHQFMRDMLPGSWNHRLSKSGSGHSLKSPIGGNGALLERNLGNIRLVNVALHNNDNLSSQGINGASLRVEEPETTFDSTVVPHVIRMKHTSKNLPILRPKFVQLYPEVGVTQNGRNTATKVWFSATSGLVGGMDRPATIETDTQGLIPETWPSRWATGDMGNQKPVIGFSPSGKKASKGEAGQHEVHTHPLLAEMFEEIIFSSSTKIKDVVLGISRSKGVSIRYQLDHKKDAVFGHEFNTDGIKHKISQSLKDKVKHNSTYLVDRTFNADFWKFIEHHFERIEFSSEETRFQLKDLQKVLMLMMYDANEDVFPSTFGQVINQLEKSQIPSDIFEEYIGSISQNVQLHIRDTLTPFYDKYNLESSNLYDLEELKISFEEWQTYTVLNTIGQLLVQSAADYTGVEEEKLAFYIDVNELSVTLYDDDTEGNGSCDLINRFYLISKSTRAANGNMRAPPLPQSDFVSKFEKQFITCEEHVANRLVFESMEEGYELPRKVREYRLQIESMKKRHSQLWNELKVKSVGRSSLLLMIAPVLRNRLFEQFPDISVDEIEQSLHSCSIGCFVCNGATRSSAFPLSVADRYTSRGVLDKIVNFGPQCKGYLDGKDRNKYGVLSSNRIEKYPHWHKDNDQEYFEPVTIFPRQIGTFVRRSQSNEAVNPIRLVRLIDHREDLL